MKKNMLLQQIQDDESTMTPTEPTETEDQATVSPIPRATKVNPRDIAMAVDEAWRSSTVCTSSKRCAAALFYLKNTVPRFSISATVEEILSAGLKRRYPHLMTEIEHTVPQTARKPGGRSQRKQ